MPQDVDVVLDCRFLPNPYWDEVLRPLSGLDPEVEAFLEGHSLTGDFLDRLRSMLELLMPAYRDEGKAYLTIAFGCTGGRHRSVMTAEKAAGMLSELGVAARVVHRDLEK